MIPKTYFSTPLSKSAKDTEGRIRNIFEGQRRRPAVIVLALVAAVALLCGSVVAVRERSGADSIHAALNIPFGADRVMLEGEVLGTVPDAGETSYRIGLESGKQAVIRIGADTLISSWADGFDEGLFRSGGAADVRVSADCSASVGRLTLENGETAKVYSARIVHIGATLLRDVIQLTGGASLDAWEERSYTIYQTKNGTELLRVHEPTGPQNVYVGGVESLDDADETARDTIIAWYAGRGNLYDLRAELESAYAEWVSTPPTERYFAHTVEQTVAPTASNNDLLFFTTSLILPLNGRIAEDRRTGEVFDRHTGAYLSNAALFDCPADELAERLLTLAEVPDARLREEMRQAFQPEYIVVLPDSVTLEFPQGTLPSEEFSYILSLNYDDALLGLMHDWAVPYGRESGR